MKNIIYLVLAISFIGCSSGEDEEVIDSIPVVILPKTKTNFEADSYEEYYYNGEKLIESRLWSDDVYISKTIYTYIGDLISETEYFDESGNSSNSLGSNYYSYDDKGRLKENKILTYEDGGGLTYKTGNYTYNSDGTITVIITKVSGEFKTIIYSFSDNEIVEVEITDGKETATSTSSFDGKNNPFKNVLGYDKTGISRYHQQNLEYYYQRTLPSGDVENETVREYTYNLENYPKTIKEIHRYQSRFVFESNSYFTYTKP
jgi:hypothetical protein